MIAINHRIVATIVALGVLVAGVFSALVVLYGIQLRTEIRGKIIDRDAAVLSPVAQQQIESTTALAALLPDAKRHGTLALAIFDDAGVTLDQVPANQPLVELPLDDFVHVQAGRALARFHPAYRLITIQSGAALDQTSPVLEIILPLRRKTSGDDSSLLGFVRYHFDARVLAAELNALDESVRKKTTLTLTLGILAISLLVIAAYLVLARAQHALTERNRRLARSHYELSLAAKTSALGQITAHLMHELRGPVSGLNAVVNSGDSAATAGYARRLQVMIQETSDLLSDQTAQAVYELTGAELIEIIRRRNAQPAEERNVGFWIQGDLVAPIDSHRGGLLCLITNNLVQNAIEAAGARRSVRVDVSSDHQNVTITVCDEGPGIPEALRSHLFTPGKSGRVGGSGLGLAISQLIARQIGATLNLVSTGAMGTTFAVVLPVGANQLVGDG
jgi:signal transduction histidine kinase